MCSSHQLLAAVSHSRYLIISAFSSEEHILIEVQQTCLNMKTQYIRVANGKLPLFNFRWIQSLFNRCCGKPSWAGTKPAATSSGACRQASISITAVRLYTNTSSEPTDSMPHPHLSPYYSTSDCPCDRSIHWNSGEAPNLETECSLQATTQGV